MGQARNWSKKEEEYLIDKWGTISIPAIARKLQRTENAVTQKAQRLNLGAFLESGEYISLNQLCKALGIDYKYKMISWVKKRSFPIHTKRVKNNSFQVVYIKEFWKWAEKNQSFLDFSKFEENAIGQEPGWVKEKRKHDYRVNREYKKSPWTPTEDARLIKLLKDYRYNYSDMSRMMQRTAGGIQRRIVDMGLKERPLRESTQSKWEEWQFQKLYELIQNGMGYEYMQDVIGKSTKAIRGKVYILCGSERLDIAREKMKGNNLVST